MFTINEDKSVSVTRGDIMVFRVTAMQNGEDYTFKEGDTLRMRVFEKKNCEKVMMVKDFPVTEATKEVEVFLGEEDTKIGPVISKPTTYWYEIELNPDTYPQTIIGYDEDGPKPFLLYPEGKEITEGELDDHIKGDVQQIIENTVLANLPEIKNDMWYIGGESTGKPSRGRIGEPGVYVGSGVMPEGYTVQFDPEGEYIFGGPKIENGTWWLWDEDTGDYVDTGVPATGPKGDPGGAALTEADKADLVAQVLAALPNGDDTEYPEGDYVICDICGTTFATKDGYAEYQACPKCGDGELVVPGNGWVSFIVDGIKYTVPSGTTWAELLASNDCPMGDMDGSGEMSPWYFGTTANGSTFIFVGGGGGVPMGIVVPGRYATIEPGEYDVVYWDGE